MHIACVRSDLSFGEAYPGRMGRTTNTNHCRHKARILDSFGFVRGCVALRGGSVHVRVRAARDAIVNPEATPSVARIAAVPP